MKLTVAWLPAAGMLLIASLLWRFPISRQRHAQMMAEIESRTRTETQLGSGA